MKVSSNQQKFHQLSILEQYKKLNRKLKRALRLNEPYTDILENMISLDDKVASSTPKWQKGGYKDILAKYNVLS